MFPGVVTFLTGSITYINLDKSPHGIGLLPLYPMFHLFSGVLKVPPNEKKNHNTRVSRIVVDEV